MKESATASDTPPSPRQIVEALLFVGGPPMSAERAGEIVRNLSFEQLRMIVDDLNRDYRRQGRPYVIHAGESGYTLLLKPQFRGVRERLAGSPREARLTPAAVDVLSLIAYRQPQSKLEIDSQRGMDSRGPLQQLVRLGLIAVVQRPELGPKEAAYITTARFLEHFNLATLDDLPQTGDLQRL
jgi:segregation and condensation protein B